MTTGSQYFTCLDLEIYILILLLYFGISAKELITLLPLHQSYVVLVCLLSVAKLLIFFEILSIHTVCILSMCIILNSYCHLCTTSDLLGLVIIVVVLFLCIISLDLRIDMWSIDKVYVPNFFLTQPLAPIYWFTECFWSRTFHHHCLRRPEINLWRVPRLDLIPLMAINVSSQIIMWKCLCTGNSTLTNALYEKESWSVYILKTLMRGSNVYFMQRKNLLGGLFYTDILLFEYSDLVVVFYPLVKSSISLILKFVRF